MLPNFLLIGAPRSGTTTLYHWLRGHPQVFLSAVKEPNFFLFQKQKRIWLGGDWLMLPGYSWNWKEYIRLFAKAREGPFRAVGEASVHYLMSSDAARQIRELLPNVRLIAILRDPVERAFSHYAMGIRAGWAPPSFQDALEREQVLWERWSCGEDDLMAEALLRHCYRHAGEYSHQIARYFDLFGRDRFLVLLYEDLTIRPQVVYQRMCRFLNIDPDLYTPDFKARFNRSGKPVLRFIIRFFQNLPYEHPLRQTVRLFIPYKLRELMRSGRGDKGKIPLDARKTLLHYFTPQVHQLEQILGYHLSHWLEKD